MTRFPVLLALCSVFSAACAQSPRPDPREFHFRSFVVDTHNDVAQRMLAGEDIAVRTRHGHSDLPRLFEGGVDLQLFSIWVPPGRTERSYYERAMEQIDSIDRLRDRAKDRFGLAGTAAQAESIAAGGRLAGMYGLEGGHPIEDDLGKLEEFYRRGVRYMTLTWNNSTSWATSASDETNPERKLDHRGLTEFGRRVVRTMNDLGMLVDVSHVGEETFRHVMSVTRKPVIASHSSVWAISPHRRNLKDWQLDEVRKNGGVVFINFAPWFVDSTFGRRESAMKKANAARIDSIIARMPGDEFMKEFYAAEVLAAEYDPIRPTLEQVLDHFEYVYRRIGADHVGIGSDYDGINVTPAGLEDVTKLPDLTAGLFRRGLSPAEVEKVLGGNFQRVLRAAEAR